MTTSGNRVIVAGAGGLIGSQLIPLLRKKEYVVQRLVRPTSGGTSDADSPRWNPEKGVLDATKLEGVTAIVHLGGANVAGGRWTEQRKALLRESRLKSTALLSRTIAKLKQPPRVFLCASAIGVYGDRGDQLLDEGSEFGKGFLARLGNLWERATLAAADAGVRVVNLRTGIVLSTQGGALPKMLTPFKLGLGGRLGPGTQYMSWISITDVVAAMAHCLEKPELNGPVNLVAPKPVTNAEFARTLADVLGKPAFMPVPGFLIKGLMGDMGRELLLASQRVVPQKLRDSKFTFRHPRLDRALRYVLKEGT